MNAEHQQLCASPEWTAYLRTDILPRLASGVDLGARMLEVGPGPGGATGWLCERVKWLTALEVDPVAADALATRFSGTNVDVTVGDCARTTFADGSFDSVASFNMLHHLPTLASQQAMLGEAFRLLRPGGVLIGSDSLASNDLHRFHADDVYNPIDPVRLLVMLQMLGCRPITVVVGDELIFTAHKPDATQGE
ncbi:MAG: class I SAM-dependent methyltransferase [Acidimicrobiales bacterium]